MPQWKRHKKPLLSLLLVLSVWELGKNGWSGCWGYWESYNVDASEIQAVAIVDMVFISHDLPMGFLYISWWLPELLKHRQVGKELSPMWCLFFYGWPSKSSRIFGQVWELTLTAKASFLPSIYGTSKFPWAFETNPEQTHGNVMMNTKVARLQESCIWESVLLLEIMCCMMHFSSACVKNRAIKQDEWTMPMEPAKNGMVTK